MAADFLSVSDQRDMAPGKATRWKGRDGRLKIVHVLFGLPIPLATILDPSRRCRTVAFRCLALRCCRLRLRPDGGQEQSYGDSHGNFEEPMDGDHPCRLGTRYEHDDGQRNPRVPKRV